MTDTINLNESKTYRLRKGEQLTVTCAASSTATVVWKNRNEGGTDNGSFSLVASEAKQFGPFVTDEIFKVSCLTGSLTVDSAAVDGDDVTSVTTLLGAVNAPATGSISVNIDREGFFYRIDLTLTSVPITHTDAAGSGSSGSVKLFDFVQGAILPIGCRTNLTLTSDTTMDVAGDMAGVFALGSAAANAGDGALSGTEVDFAATKAFTLSSNTLAVGTNITAVGTGVDGTATAADLYLNESGSAATSDANGVMTVSGTISLLIAFLGDD